MNYYSVNKVISSDFLLIEQRLIPNENTLIVKIDGKDVKKWDDYSCLIADKFEFPYGAEGYDGYYDWITDLGWLSDKGVNNFVLVIKNYTNKFLCKDNKSKKILEELFNDGGERWENDDNPSRNFVIYLID